MARLWILVGLLSLCSPSVSEECNQNLLENVDFYGADIESLYSPDVKHCQLLCTQHPACRFFTFIRADWTRDNTHFRCYLKSNPSGSPNTQVPLLGATSGFSLKPCNLDPEPCLSEVYQNVDFFGADYRSLFTSDNEACQRACTQDPACQFFTFTQRNFSNNKIRYKCHLKFSWNVPRTPIVEAKAGVTSGFSHKMYKSQYFDKVCERLLFPNTDIPGSDITSLPAASSEHCQTLCLAHPLCTFFTYTSSNFKCYLKNNLNEMVTAPKEEATSGLPSHLCQLDDSWVQVVHPGVDFRGSDVRNELTDDVDTCQRACTEDLSCQFYAYDENSHHYDNRHRCYLKRVITLPAPPKVAKLSNAVSGFSLKNCV